MDEESCIAMYSAHLYTSRETSRLESLALSLGAGNITPSPSVRGCVLAQPRICFEAIAAIVVGWPAGSIAQNAGVRIGVAIRRAQV